MVIGQSFNAGEIIKFLSQVTFGSVAVGLAFGIASVLWLGFIFNDTVIEIALTLAVSYIAFFTAQDGLEASGILTVMTLGIFYAAVAKTAFKGDSQQSLHHFWEMIAYIANTLIFILSGVVIAEGVLRSDYHFERHGASWGYLMLLYGFVLLSRVIVVGLLFPFLRYFGYGLDWKESIILGWSGLRGAVALSLAVTVKRASDNVDQSFIKPEVGTLFVFFTGGIVFLTLIVNGSTTQFLLQLLSMDKLSAAKIRILNYTRYEMLNKALEAFGDLGDDEELGNVDWPTVQRYITCLNDLGEGQVHPHDVSDGEHHLRSMNLSDIRVRLLNGVQAAYWEMLEEGRISQNTATLLMRSVDEAMDKVSNETLCDWKGLKANVQFPRYYRYLQSSRLPRRIVTYFTVERLETACYISAAFLRAHRIARRQLYDFIGDSEVASKVISESNNEGEEARKFLEDVRVTFPQVLRVVKTKQVTFSILNHLSNYVQNLEKAGLLEQKEMLHLDDAVQTDLKKLLRNPPLVRMPKRRDLLDVHPLLGALPPAPREILEGATKEAMKISGITLYSEGSKPDGIWLISTGAVRWASKSLSNWHALHPTFSHGSTLGLYEVLTGKPYICNTITDTVVHCFFIETEIIQALRSDPTIEDFLWQESAIVIAKILLPQIFEKMSMQEMRVLVAERSTMNSYARGELIESRPNFVFFLLEGFIRTQEAPDDLITSPAALLSSHIDLRFLGLELSAVRNASFCHMGSMFLVETTARVICFEAGSIEADAVLQKRLSSNILPSSETQRSLSASHGGLLSWPENLYKARGQHQSSSEVHKEPTSLSAKAMQLSIYGSMSNNMHRRRGGMRSYARSLSYPRLPSKAGNTRPLISAKSEGGSVNRRLLSEESRKASIPPLPVRRGKAKVVEDDSSGESGGEEVIVRIDSPSTLSFRLTSGNLFPPRPEG